MSLPKGKIIDSAELAKKAGHPKSENMVLVGAALQFIPVNIKTIEDSIKTRFQEKDPKLVDINITALELGKESVQ